VNQLERHCPGSTHRERGTGEHQANARDNYPVLSTLSTLPLFPTRTFTLFPTGLRDSFYSMAAPFARRRVASSSLS
jgi:hypothetical protein